MKTRLWNLKEPNNADAENGFTIANRMSNTMREDDGHERVHKNKDKRLAVPAATSMEKSVK